MAKKEAAPKTAVEETEKLASTALNLTEEQVELIKNTVARGATDDELKLFLYTAARTGLDPFTNQIHFVKRRTWNRDAEEYQMTGTIQTGIDGYRAIAERTGELAGIEDAIFEGEGTYPKKATVTVYRIVKGRRVGFTASARWDEYAPMNASGDIVSPMWRKMPHLMLAKCAEALALRKAFPNDLSGLYTNEEMAQARTQGEAAKAKQEKKEAEKEVLGLKKKIFLHLKALRPGIENWKSPEAVRDTIEELTALEPTEENLETIENRLRILRREEEKTASA